MTGLIGALVPPPLSLAIRLAPYAALVVTSGLAWHFEGRATANANLVRSQAASFERAQATAALMSRQALAHENAVFQSKAQEADHAYQAQLADARSAADRYIAANRVPAATFAGNAQDVAAAAHRNSAGIPEELPADTVMVSATDLQACTDATTYALRAHAWTETLNP